MTRAGKSRLARFRALCAALFLLIAAVSAPIALAAHTVDVCGMTCCVKEGFCCCSPHHASVAGQVSDDKPRLNEPDLSASCPEGCAPTARFSNLLLRHHLLAGAHLVVVGEQSPIFLEELIAASDPLNSGSSTPRAPPVSSKI